jgi:uncharacterized membrane protein
MCRDQEPAIPRLPFKWYDLKDSLWFRPAIMTVLAVVLAIAMVQIDHAFLREKRIHTWWLFEGGAEGARGVLSAIAGTVMTIATTAFSITIVALQLASSQFSPLILRGFTGDRGNQLVLGAFIGTFVYSLLVLRAVRSETADNELFVPSASITLAILMALGCIASLIFFFHHATRTIQASVIIDRTANDTYRLIDAYREATSEDEAIAPAMTMLDRLPAVASVGAGHPGYVQGVDSERLVDLAREHDVLLQIHARIGDFLFTGSELATVRPYARADADGAGAERDPEDGPEALAEGVREAFSTGLERTLEQDVLLGFQQLADMGLKALSPGINDPTTATLVIDRLGEALLRVREVVARPVVRCDDEGTARVVFPRVAFGTFLQTAFLQMRHYGAGDPVVVLHLLRTLRVVGDGGQDEAREAVASEARTIVEAASDQALPADLERIRDAAAWAYAGETSRAGR